MPKPRTCALPESRVCAVRAEARRAAAWVCLLAMAVSCGDDTSAAHHGKGTHHDAGPGPDGSPEASPGAGGTAGSHGGSVATGGSATSGGAPTSGGGADASPTGPSTRDAAADATLDGGAALCTPVNIPPPALTAGPRLSQADLGQTFVAIEGVVRATPVASNRQTDAETLRTAIAKVPNVATTAIASDCTVLVQFTDGTPLSIFDDGSSAPIAENDGGPLPEVLTPPALAFGMPAASPAPARRSQLLLAATATNLALPASGKALVGSIFDNDLYATDDEPTTPLIKSALEKRGYSVTDQMTSAALRNDVKDLGVMSLTTHGSFFCWDKQRLPVLHYCITAADPETDCEPGNLGCTNDPACALNDPIQCALNQADVYANYVASYAMHRETSRAMYAINEGWVTKYWSFAKNSFVHLNICNAMSLLEGPTLFRQALVTKGAGTIAGWNGLVNTGFSKKTARFLFDRLLGANLDKVTPPQRPFSLPEVFAAMQAKGLMHDYNNPPSILNRGGTELAIKKYVDSDVILAPSIRNLSIGDWTNPKVTGEEQANTEMDIAGELGSAQGTVEIGCTDPPACTTGTAASLAGGGWTSTKASVSIPSTGTGSGGSVQIRVTAGSQVLTSNATPLTSWKGACHAKVNFTYAFGPPGPVLALSCSRLHFRADVHPFRFAPEEAATAGSTDANGTRTPLFFLPNTASDSVCNGSVQGQGTNAVGTSIFTAASKSPIPWMDLPTQNALPTASWYYDPQATIDPVAQTFAPQVAFRVVSTLTIIEPDGTQAVFPNTPEAALVVAPAVPFGAGYGVSQPSESITNQEGTWTFDCNLPADAGSAPDQDTEG